MPSRGWLRQVLCGDQHYVVGCVSVLRKIAISKALLKRVDRLYVISGIGERPAIIVHMRECGTAGIHHGSGRVAPELTQRPVLN